MEISLERTELLLDWHSLLCLPPLRTPLDRHSAGVLPAFGASAEADDSIQYSMIVGPKRKLTTNFPSLLSMRAFVIKQLSHPSKVELTEDAPDPKPAPDQILVDVYSAGLNFYDVSTRPDGLSHFILDEHPTDDVSFPRFCRPRGNTRAGRNSHLFWAQNLPV